VKLQCSVVGWLRFECGNLLTKFASHSHTGKINYTEHVRQRNKIKLKQLFSREVKWQLYNGNVKLQVTHTINAKSTNTWYISWSWLIVLHVECVLSSIYARARVCLRVCLSTADNMRPTQPSYSSLVSDRCHSNVSSSLLTTSAAQSLTSSRRCRSLLTPLFPRQPFPQQHRLRFTIAHYFWTSTWRQYRPSFLLYSLLHIVTYNIYYSFCLFNWQMYYAVSKEHH